MKIYLACLRILGLKPEPSTRVVCTTLKEIMTKTIDTNSYMDKYLVHICKCKHMTTFFPLATDKVDTYMWGGSLVS